MKFDRSEKNPQNASNQIDSTENLVTRDNSQDVNTRSRRFSDSQIRLAVSGANLDSGTIGNMVNGVCGVYPPICLSMPA